ncbi:MAG TPA: DNA alkylation repair protein [Blastocatellia bacterium]
MLRGLSTQEVRGVRRSITKELASAPPDLIIELALRLVDNPSFVFRFIAYEVILHHRAALGSLGASEVEMLGRGINSWGDVDTFACYVAGPAWREGQIPDDVIRRWARSEDRWWRRAALVSTVPLNNKARGGTGNTERTLEVCQMLIDDRDDMVVKALSWALRELVKLDPDSVESFLSEHEEKLAKRVLREVRNKLSTGLKNPAQVKRERRD